MCPICRRDVSNLPLRHSNRSVQTTAATSSTRGCKNSSTGRTDTRAPVHWATHESSRVKEAKRHRLNRWCQAESSVQAPYYWAESMSKAQKPTLQHWLNRWSSVQGVGATHWFNRWLLSTVSEGQRLVWSCMWPVEPKVPHRFNRCPHRKKGNNCKRLVQLGGLYIWVLRELLELLEVSHTSKNISKLSKRLVIISLVLSTSLREREC